MVVVVVSWWSSCCVVLCGSVVVVVVLWSLCRIVPLTRRQLVVLGRWLPVAVVVVCWMCVVVVWMVRQYTQNKKIWDGHGPAKDVVNV